MLAQPAASVSSATAPPRFNLTSRCRSQGARNFSMHAALAACIFGAPEHTLQPAHEHRRPASFRWRNDGDQLLLIQMPLGLGLVRARLARKVEPSEPFLRQGQHQIHHLWIVLVAALVDQDLHDFPMGPRPMTRARLGHRVIAVGHRQQA